MKQYLIFLATACFFTTSYTAEPRGIKRPATKQFDDCAEVTRRVDDEWSNKKTRFLQPQGTVAEAELAKILAGFPPKKRDKK